MVLEVGWTNVLASSHPMPGSATSNHKRLLYWTQEKRSQRLGLPILASTLGASYVNQDRPWCLFFDLDSGSVKNRCCNGIFLYLQKSLNIKNIDNQIKYLI